MHEIMVASIYVLDFATHGSMFDTVGSLRVERPPKERRTVPEDEDIIPTDVMIVGGSFKSYRGVVVDDRNDMYTVEIPGLVGKKRHVIGTELAEPLYVFLLSSAYPHIFDSTDICNRFAVSAYGHRPRASTPLPSVEEKTVSEVQFRMLFAHKPNGKSIRSIARSPTYHNGRTMPVPFRRCVRAAIRGHENAHTLRHNI